MNRPVKVAATNKAGPANMLTFTFVSNPAFIRPGTT